MAVMPIEPIDHLTIFIPNPPHLPFAFRVAHYNLHNDTTLVTNLTFTVYISHYYTLCFFPVVIFTYWLTFYLDYNA
jgi:hypothetical protein